MDTHTKAKTNFHKPKTTKPFVVRVDGSSLSVSVGFGVVFSRERKLKMCFLCFEGFRERDENEYYSERERGIRK